MRLVIDRTRWYRGQGPRESKLIRSQDNKMCCLGFLGLECGGTRDNTDTLMAAAANRDPGPGLVGQGYPARIQEFWPRWLFEELNMSLLAEVNDNPRISDQERELEITKIMGRNGVEVEFVDGETP